jgi:glycosyltransferase involved in cell wall biosynthesis
MRIAIEATASCRTPRTGIAQYTIHLVDALAELAERESGDEIRIGYRLSRWKYRRVCHAPPRARTFWIQEPVWPVFPGVDVVHGTDARVPHWRGAARVATVHDLGVHLYPEYANEKFRAAQMEKYHRLARDCHKIIVYSDATRRDFLQLVGFPGEHIVTIPMGVEPIFRIHGEEEVQAMRASLGLEKPYLLYVGEISIRKNTHNLVKAFAETGRTKDYQLVLAGPLAFRSEPTLEAVTALGLEKDVRRLGYLAYDQLPPLYAGASAYVFATGYEGFGLPSLEAMASGVPVVGSDRGATPEVTGGHAVIVDPENPRDIAAGILRALKMTPEAREAARRHAASFTWEACARATRIVYEQAVARRARG